MNEHNLNICTLSETFMTKDVKDSEFTPEGYVIFRLYRDLNVFLEGTYKSEERGGVLIKVKSDLNPEIVLEDAMAAIAWVTIAATIGVVGEAYSSKLVGVNCPLNIWKSIYQIDYEDVVLTWRFF